MSSNAVSAHYGVECKTCGAEADQPCRSRKTFRITDTHAARRSAYWRKREAALRSARQEDDPC